jgi:ribonuclease PH
VSLVRWLSAVPNRDTETAIGSYLAGLYGLSGQFRFWGWNGWFPIWDSLAGNGTAGWFSYNLSMANLSPGTSGAAKISTTSAGTADFFRADGRATNELRPLTLTPGFVRTAEGSVLISVGHTRVLCNATIENGVPSWLRNSGRGWVTAEYAMLPRSTVTRTARESERGKIGGRTHEIQRLIGRSLRSVVDMQALGERTVILDCDVIQADGGTRTAAITGACVALALAFNALVKAGSLKASPLRQLVAATSVGIVEGAALLDLCYEEDSQAEVDMNVVMTADGGLVETQATAEKGSYSRAQLNELIDLAEGGLREIFAAQRLVLGGV